MNRLKQVVIIALGLLLAATMVLLGIWQLDVYHAQGSKVAAATAAAPPVDLSAVAPAGAAVTTGFGRSVRFQGTYDPALALLVPVDGNPGMFRVLTGLRQTDGSIVPVVRGLTDRQPAPLPPAGRVSQVGVLLPSEDDAPVTTTAAGQISSVRVPTLAQSWPGPLVGGFVTLSADDARAQRLAAAPLQLPQATGRLRNAAYALQWWVFAAFALGMAIRISRDYGLREDLLSTDEMDGGLGRNPT